MSRLLHIVFFFEVGFVLAFVPWSSYWDRNYFADTLPWVRIIVTNNFARGAVTGLGQVNLAAGMAELLSLLVARHEDEPVLSMSSIDE